MAWKWPSLPIYSNHWIYESSDFYLVFTPAKVVIYQSIHTSDLAGFLAHVQKISRLFKHVLSLGFLCSSLSHFWSFFLFTFIKWNSTRCQIYWIPDLQSLKLVCFMVVSNWERNYADSWLILTRSLQDSNF